MSRKTEYEQWRDELNRRPRRWELSPPEADRIMGYAWLVVLSLIALAIMSRVI
jgi:hypothetical protein